MRRFTIKADGGSRGNPGKAAYGFVIYENEKVIAEGADYIGVATNNVAEYSGLLAGLRSAHSMDPNACIHVKMDSQLVIRQMTGEYKIKNQNLLDIATQAIKIFPTERVSYTWIPREQNKEPDVLLNIVLDQY
jgi:probable phosphoglycerate mutase